jgi:hypothetical protein
MIPLAIGIAVLDKHARLTCLETDIPLLLAAFGTALGSSQHVDDGPLLNANKSPSPNLVST